MLLLTSQGLPWSQIFSWYHRHAFSKIHRWTRRFLSPCRTGVGGGKEETPLEDYHQSSHPTKTKKKRKSSALLYFAKGFLAVCQRRLSCFPMHAARRAHGGFVCPTPRGYLTNLFDVADPEPELPHCSDHCDGETQALPLLLPRQDSVSIKRRCCELKPGYLQEDDTWQAHPSCCAIESHRPPCGCYSNRRSGRLLLPPIYLTACTMNDLSVRIAPNHRPGRNSAGVTGVKHIFTF